MPNRLMAGKDLCEMFGIDSTSATKITIVGTRNDVCVTVEYRPLAGSVKSVRGRVKFVPEHEPAAEAEFDDGA